MKIVNNGTMIVKGKIGRYPGPPHINKRVYSRSIMEREFENLTILSLKSVSEVEAFAMKTYEKHDIGMLAIAEALATPEEVMALLLPRAERSFRRAKREHRPVGQARAMIHTTCFRFLEETHYHLPRRKVTIDRIAKDLLKGYQKWWGRVDRHRKLLEAQDKKAGVFGYGYARKAVEKLSPELFEDAS